MGASIPLPALGIKPVEQPDLLQQFGQIGALKNQQLQGQIGQQHLQQEQLQTQGMQQQQQRDAQIQQILQSEPDPNKAVMQIMKVDPAKGFQLRKAQQEYQNADLDGKNKILDNHQKKAEALGQLAGTVKDEPSKMAAIQQAVQIGALDPAEAQQYAQQPFTPELPQQWQTQAQTVAQQIQQKKDELAATETHRHNVATEDQTKNPTEASLALKAAQGDKDAEAALKRLDQSKIASRPVNVNASNSRSDRSYQYNNTVLDKVGKPVEDASARMGRLQETLANGSPQADALVAPELLSVMAGGQGSGLRMNEAEISRVIGGRSKWESLKASISQWSTDPTKANSITPEQRSQIRALVGAVNAKLVQKQAILDQGRQQLSNEDDPVRHRKIVNDTRTKLMQIDAGSAPAPQTQQTQGAGGFDWNSYPTHPQ